MRYFGQASEVRVDVPGGPLTRESADIAVDNFHTAHEQTYALASTTAPTRAALETTT